jgi:hydrogenase nickel incorporation protein HypA/HybF
MHELSIAATLLEMVETEARKAGLSCVSEITVRVGPLSGVNPEALDFCFGAVKDRSLCKDAKLTIDTPPGVVNCRACGRTAEFTEIVFFCPSCGASDIRLNASRELELREITGE